MAKGDTAAGISTDENKKQWPRKRSRGFGRTGFRTQLPEIR